MDFSASQAREDFNRAKKRAFLGSIIHLLHPEKRELLSFYDVRTLIKPKKENYRGMQVVAIANIVGSEGRYRDFNKEFFPKKEHLRNRWERVDQAIIKDIILPPIKLYKLGDLYFVRDGNHRVSVARLQGIEAIDAEVTELDAEIKLTPKMTVSDMKEELISYERKRIFSTTGMDKIIPCDEIKFTAPGRFDEIIRHIYNHKYRIDQNEGKAISFEEACKGWYENVFLPIITVVNEEHIAIRFPGRTPADIYAWSVKHQIDLKERYGDDLPLEKAAKNLSLHHGHNFFQRLIIHIQHMAARASRR